MSFLHGPLDDTVQLDVIATEVDTENMTNFPPSYDTVRIVPGQEDSDEEILEDVGETRESGEGEESIVEPSNRRVSKKAIFSILVMTFINLLNYMDRFTIAGESKYRYCLD